jgi:hypothetical protein
METQDNKKNKVDSSSDCISPGELVRRHLQNENHEISDSDLQKVALDCNEDNSGKSADVQVPDATSITMNNSSEEIENSEPEKKEKDILPTPLDVLG